MALGNLGTIYRSARAAALTEAASLRADRTLFADPAGRPILRSCIVTYLDVLGTKERAKNLTDTTLRAELEDLDRFQGLLHSDFWDGDRQKFVAFSDNVAVAAPIDPSGDNAILYHQIDAAANYQFQRTLRGRAVRGGISTGMAFCDGRLIDGPAHLEAVMLEEGTAVTPRVILSTEVSAVLRAAYAAGGVPKPWPRQLVAVDSDGWLFVNYLAVCLPSSPRPEVKLQQHLVVIERMLASGLPIAVHTKWLWVGSYHDWFVRQYLDGDSSLTTSIGQSTNIHLL